MKKDSKKIKAILLLILLSIISIIVILILGRTYTFKNLYNKSIENKDDLIVKIEDENIATCIDKSLDGNEIVVRLRSKSMGKTYIEIYNKEEAVVFFPIYVHMFGIITYSEYMGDCHGSIIIPISIIIWLSYILYLLVITYRKSVKENIYQYKNIAYMGMMTFISFTILNQLSELFRYSGLINTINSLLNMSGVSLGLLPIAFITSILVIISNLVLVKREGFNLKNLLGVLLGTFLCFTTILPDLLYNALNDSTIINIHGQNGIGVYIYNFIEAVIYITISYIECVLIGTIVVGFKSSKKVPDFDKDFIIILGCQIKKDGTLTKLLQGRVDRAIEFAKMQEESSGKKIVYVTSGGKGDDEIMSEAQSMKNYMLDQGIEEKNIIVEDKSKNTYENIKNSIGIIKEKMKDAKIAFSTTNYHVFRAGNIATEQNNIIQGIGAKTKSYFWVNAFIREFIATLVKEKKKHFAVLFSIIVIAIIMIAITYLNNNI